MLQFKNCKMKKIIFFILLCSFQCIQSQEVITKEFVKFNVIKAFDGLSINLIKSDINKAIISGENTEKVVIVNNNGVLKLRMQIDKIFSGYKTFIDVYYTEDLLVVDVNEDARIISADIIIQDLLELKAQEGGEIELTTQVEQLLIKSITGGIITTNGFSNNQDVIVNTGGKYNGKAFKTKFSTINVNSGSKAAIYATNYVKAIAKAGGTVEVYGKPSKIDEKTIFGGKVIKM